MLYHEYLAKSSGKCYLRDRNAVLLHTSQSAKKPEPLIQVLVRYAAVDLHVYRRKFESNRIELLNLVIITKFSRYSCI
jgi:hypothetical protein